MKKLILTALVASLVSLTIQAAPIFTMDFEASEGYTAGQTIIGQNGWTKIWYNSTGDEISTTDPQHGSQCFSYTINGSDTANAFVRYDISTLCEETDKLLFKGYYKYNGEGNSGCFRLESKGSSSINYNNEIFQLNCTDNGEAEGKFKATMQGKKELTVSGLAKNTYHEITALIDPANQNILRLSIDSTFQNYDDNKYLKYGNVEGLGKLPDGFRIMQRGIIDNLTIEVIPEPAIFGLLALVGLFLRRK